MKRTPLIAGIALSTAIATVAISLPACAPSSNENPGNRADSEPSAISVAWNMESDCSTCHAAEAGSRDDPSCLAATHAANACTACHTDKSSLEAAHANASADGPMPKKLKKTEVPEGACLSCHGDRDALAQATNSTTILTDAQGTTVNPHALPESDSHSTMACGDCHSMHVGEDVAAVAPQACLNCHHENVYECSTCHE